LPGPSVSNWRNSDEARSFLAHLGFVVQRDAHMCISTILQPGSGQLTSISVGGTQTGAAAVWGINSAAQNIFEFDGIAFQNVPGNLTQIAADGATVWGINANGNVFKFDPNQAGFVQIQGNLSQIAAHGGATWGIDANQNVYEYDGTGFVQVPGKLTQIAVDGPAVWGINASQNVFRFSEVVINNNRLAGGFQQIPGSLTAIAVGALGSVVWGIDANQNVFRFDDASQTFVNVPGKLKSLAVGGPLLGPNDVWGIDANQNIFVFSASSLRFMQVPGQLTQISVFGLNVWGINANQNIFRLLF
jgi:Tectonin domain